MNLNQINAALRNVNLPSLSEDQLRLLDAAGERRQFEVQAAGSSDYAYLEIIVRSLSPSLPATLAQLGLAYEARSFIAIAKKNKMPLFAALHVYRTKVNERDLAASFLLGLGFPVTSAVQKTPDQSSEPPYYSFKIFGQSAALCICEAKTRSGCLHTVQIEGAGALSGGTSRRYDWPNKITIQLTTQEAYQTLALFENKIRTLKFDGHGMQHDKSLQIEFQDANYFVRMIQRGRPALAVPVRPVNALPVVSLLYKQILLNEPHLGLSDVRTMIDRMVNMAKG